MTAAPTRCAWKGMQGDPLYEAYHDDEWGVPERDPRALWEKLVLDGFQAGLSWITILRKREAFRRAFANFDPEVVARYGETDRARLMADAGIIRSNAKIDAAIAGARIFLDMR
jgi:DNA-3-methyladenine glycosylase I